VSSGVQLGDSPEGNAEHNFKNYNTLHNTFVLLFISTFFFFALRSSPATIDPTLAYHGYILLYATTT
jgi:hypothetical protein